MTEPLHPRQSRVRKPKVRLRLQVGYSFRWDELDMVSGEGGTGLRKALRLWWQLRRGTWQDDDLPDWGDYPVLTGSTDPLSDPQPGDPAYCEACGGPCRDES